MAGTGGSPRLRERDSPWEIRLSATGNSSPFACRTEGIRALFVAWRDGRAAEGARLESVYTVHPVSWVRIPLPPPGCVSHASGKSKIYQAYSYPENRVVVAAGPLEPRRTRSFVVVGGSPGGCATRSRASPQTRTDKARNVGEIQGSGGGSDARIDGSAGERFQTPIVDRRLLSGVQGYMPQTSTFGFGLRRKIFSFQLFFSSRSKITKWPASAAQPSI